jgi:hypothetical protein
MRRLRLSAVLARLFHPRQHTAGIEQEQSSPRHLPEVSPIHERRPQLKGDDSWWRAQRRGGRDCLPVDQGNRTAHVPLPDGRHVLIDTSSIALVRGRCWSVETHGYARARLGDRTVQMHRLIMNVTLGDKVIVDHINGDRLDNRRSNLRIATVAQNSRNTRLSRLNSSGYKGVSWRSREQRWMARITRNGKSRYLGYFATAEEAARAYDAAAREAFGSFAKVNFPHQGERGVQD